MSGSSADRNRIGSSAFSAPGSSIAPSIRASRRRNASGAEATTCEKWRPEPANPQTRVFPPGPAKAPSHSDWNSPGRSENDVPSLYIMCRTEDGSHRKGSRMKNEDSAAVKGMNPDAEATFQPIL